MTQTFILKIIIYPLLGALIGYSTNWIAITLLFKPKNKIFGIQGLLQKRKRLIAEKAAELIREYLLNTNELKKVLDKTKVKESIFKLVDRSIRVVPGPIKKLISKTLREIVYKFFFDKEGYIKDEILELALSDADLENIVIEKIMNYDITELEKIIKQASSVEINFILFSGAVLGMIIGLIQAFIPI